MNISKLRPIPKAIEKRIIEIDAQACYGINGNRLYSYLTTLGKEIVKVTVALKRYQHQNFLKQVAVHGTESPECWVKDMEYMPMGMGYRFGFEDRHVGEHKPFADGQWYSADRRYYNADSYLVNLSYLKKTKYKYCGYHRAFGKNIIEYLRIYNEYPKAEYLMKMGLDHLALKRSLLEKLNNDKAFCKWIVANEVELKYNYYSVKMILQAYKMNKSIDWYYNYSQWLDQFDKCLEDLTAAFPCSEREKLYNYLDKQDCDLNIYNDYFRACKYIELDMTVDKNRYPHELMTWHDIRINQMNAKKAQEDEEKRKELYQKFATVADKYVSMQRIKDNYITLIAKSPAELIQEGEALHHCVGRMGYDEKFANEKSLIFFVRDCEQPDKPFVTLEYSIESHKVLQCYADHNHKPSDSVMQYVNKKWLPYANRHLKQIQNYAIA